MPRISLRQLLAFVAVAAVALVSLKSANSWWLGAIGIVALLTCFAALLIGIFERGPRQAFALALAITMFGYGVLVGVGPKLGYNLPTWTLLSSLHSEVVRLAWFDTNGERVPEQNVSAIVQNPTTFEYSLNGGAVRSELLPDEFFFMPLGHHWFALFFGYLGGLVGLGAYTRRRQQDAARMQE